VYGSFQLARVPCGDPVPSGFVVKHARFAWTGLARNLVAVFLLCTALLCAAGVCAQDSPGAPAGAVGRIEGRDVSVDNGASGPTTIPTSTGAEAAYILNGSIVTVHSGDARMNLLAGGEVDACGPAKFTVLLSGDAITLALNFGRVRVQLPAKANLRVFTPTIIATPLDIAGNARDVTVGLNLDDSLCVVATGGALQLEHQFSGEKLIVPQLGEFFLAAGQLLPIAGKPGSCACTASEPLIPPPSPPVNYAAIPAPLLTAPATQPELPPEPALPPPAEQPDAQPNVEFSIPADSNETHPLEPAKYQPPDALPLTIPIYTVVAPPLSFIASSPEPPSEPPLDTFLLVRETQVTPEYEFNGHVESPTFATAMKNALGEHGAPPAGVVTDQPVPGPRPHRGFWGKLKRLFGA
jgi:hypothetical protein